jgi:glycosyltransferase involved in cell wall biosynthesis
VVSTRHAGIPDVVVEEETGLLVDEGDIEAMAAAMLRLYRDRNLCAQMGAAARTRIREHFSMEKHIGLLNDLIKKAVKGG